MINQAGDDGIEEICFGMAHRGRLNVLANIMQKPFESMFKDQLHQILQRPIIRMPSILLLQVHLLQP